MHNQPILILIRGIPGSGKSYIAKSLQDRLGADAVVLLDPDATDYKSSEYMALSSKLTSEGVETKFHPYRFLRAQAYGGIESNKFIIWNQAFTNLDGFQKTVKNLENYAVEHNKNLPIIVVEVEIDPQTARQRIQKRVKSGGHQVDDQNFTRFINDYRSFANEGFTTVLVDGSGDIHTSVEAIYSAVSQAL